MGAGDTGRGAAEGAAGRLRGAVAEAVAETEAVDVDVDVAEGGGDSSAIPAREVGVASASIGAADAEGAATATDTDPDVAGALCVAVGAISVVAAAPAPTSCWPRALKKKTPMKAAAIAVITADTTSAVGATGVRARVAATPGIECDCDDDAAEAGSDHCTLCIGPGATTDTKGSRTIRSSSSAISRADAKRASGCRCSARCIQPSIAAGIPGRIVLGGGNMPA